MTSRRSTAGGDPLPPTTTVHVRAIKGDDEEETKEQPSSISTLRPQHSRPPSIQIHHQRHSSTANVSLAVASPVSPPQSSGSLPSSARSSLRGLFGRHGKKASVVPLTPSPLQPFDASATAGSPLTPRSAPPQPNNEKATAFNDTQPAAHIQPVEEQKEREGGGQRGGKHRSTASTAWLNKLRTGAVVELTAQNGSMATVDVVSAFGAPTVEEESEDELMEDEEEEQEKEQDKQDEKTGRARLVGDELRERGKSLSTVARKQATIVVEADDEADDREVAEGRKYDDGSDTEGEVKPPVSSSPQWQHEHKYDDVDDRADDEPARATHTKPSAAVTDDVTDVFSSYALPLPASLSALSACLPPALLSLLDQLRSSSPIDLSEHELSTDDRHIVQLERLSVADVKEAERRREERRLEERRAVLREWKEREWRVWKEERRVQRLLQYERDKQQAEMRKTEERVWERQGNQLYGEMATFDEQERGVIEQLYSTADVSVTALPSLSASLAAASLVDPTASFAAFPALHRRYHVHYRHAPRLLSLHIHALRSVKDKLPAGQYHIRVSLYDRLGGRPLAWTGSSSRYGSSDGSKQRRECGSASVMTREAVRHGGGWWEQEMLFGQPANRMLLACPADVDSLPSMVLLFELVMASEAAAVPGTPPAVVAWGAFPLSSFASAAAEPIVPPDANATAAPFPSSSSLATSSSAARPRLSRSTAAAPSLPFSSPSTLVTSPSSAPAASTPSPPLSPFSLSPSVACSLVSGHHRLPLLVGPYNPSIRTWHELHRRIATDLSTWLCNLYFHASDGAERVEQERDYCVDVQLGKRQQQPDDSEQKAGQDEQYVLLPPEEDGEIGERKRRRNRPLHAQNKDNPASPSSAAASLMSRRLAHMDVAHSELVRHVRASDGVAADDMSDPFAVWPNKDDDGWRWLDTGDSMDRGDAWQGGQASYEERQLAVTLRTRKRKRKLATDDNSMTAASADYQLSVSSSTSSSATASPPSLFSSLKLRYVWGHLDTVYHVSHPLSWPFLWCALLLLLVLWARLFLHYFTQYVFLSTALSSSSSLSFECSYLGCSVDYDEPLSMGTFLQLCVLGSITPLVVLLLLCPLPSLYRRLTRRSPPLLADTLLLCFAVCLIVDPFLVDNTGLYDDADSITTILVALLSVSFAIVATLVSYLYLVHLHMDGAVLDTWQRHQPAAVVDVLYCVPSDYCMPIEELMAVTAASRRWRGELGERRRVRVKEGGDGQPTYVSIVVVAVEHDKEAEAEVYRQFVLLRDGHVYELFDTRDITQQAQLAATAASATNTTSAAAGDNVAPATADAYLARLLKGRSKVMARSARQLWAIARHHFNLSHSRRSSNSRADTRRSTFVRNGTTARLSTMHRYGRSSSVVDSFNGLSPVNRMGTFGQS